MRTPRARLRDLAGLFVLATHFIVSAQAPGKYSETNSFRSTMKELSQPNAHPSLLGKGSLLPAYNGRPRVHQDKRALVLETDDWTLRLQCEPFGLQLFNKRTSASWVVPPQGLSWVSTSSGAPPIQIESLTHTGSSKDSWSYQAKVKDTAAAARITISVAAANILHIRVEAPDALRHAALRWDWQAQGPFFGLGERFAEEKVDGVKTTLKPEDLLGSKGHNWTYIPVPLLYTPQGLGLYLDTGEVTQFDLSRSDGGRFVVSMARASADLYLFAAPTPKAVLTAYTSLTGTTPLSPPWAFGPWICAYGAPEIVLAAAEQLRKAEIPASAIWTFDAMDEGDVMGWPLWRTGYYPDLRKMTDKLHQLGFKSLTYVHPYLRNMLAPYSLPNPQYEMAKQSHFLVHDPAGEPTGPRFEATHDGNIDFTDSGAVDWYQQKIRRVLLENGFDGWMEDYGEWINDDDQFTHGLQGRNMANLNAFLYHKTTFEIAKEAKADVVEFVRSGYAGSQAFTRVVWGGDQFPEWTHDAGLPSVVNAGITAGLSGFAVWGPDIAENGRDRELWKRWVEFAALTPVMRDHPWDRPAGAIDLWTDHDTMAHFKRYAALHTSLFPYLYTYAHEAQKTGLPLMRHPMLEASNEAATYDTDAEYLLGSELLVAPVVTQHATTRSLYLPKGEWVDFWTGDFLTGGRQVTVAAPLDRIPLLVRAGSVLPFLSPGIQSLVHGPSESQGRGLNDVIWRVFPASGRTSQSFAAYDGTTASAVQDGHAVNIQIRNAPARSRQGVTMQLRSHPREVLMDGTELSEASDASNVPVSGGWIYDKAQQMLQVFPAVANYRLIIRLNSL